MLRYPQLTHAEQAKKSDKKQNSLLCFPAYLKNVVTYFREKLCSFLYSAFLAQLCQYLFFKSVNFNVSTWKNTEWIQTHAHFPI